MISFCKFHGFGNDYIVFESNDLADVGSIFDFAVTTCNRHTGIGGDGIAVLEKLSGGVADYRCRIINPDGSEAGFSGNGTRCAVAYLYYKGIWGAPSLQLSTLSGVKTYTLLEHDKTTWWFSGELGKPKFKSDEIPFKSDVVLESVTNFPLTIINEQLTITALNVGNPVAVVFVPDFEFDWRGIGKEMEIHPLFPEKTNVVFVRVADKANVDVRIWERAAGETSSSGTCSVAAAVASAFTGKTEREVAVHAPGGTTEVTWREDDEMIIKGRADLAFHGEF